MVSIQESSISCLSPFLGRVLPFWARLLGVLLLRHDFRVQFNKPTPPISSLKLPNKVNADFRLFIARRRYWNRQATTRP
jgi:hypothetical protein